MRELPLFPLEMVLFPGMALDVQVFEQRYLKLMDDLSEQGSKEFGVVAISSGHEVGEENLHGFADTGCAVSIEQSQWMGPRVFLRAVGTWRFDQVSVVERGTPYLMAEVRPLTDAPVVEEDQLAMVTLRAALAAYADAADRELGDIPMDPDRLTWWLTAGGPLTRTEQLQVLGAPRAERFELLTRYLRREAVLLRDTGSVPFNSSDRRASPN